MQILYIIGNGFDINLGMKTRYCDFYEYYNNFESKNESINNLKKTISCDINTWSDLELKFGQYTDEILSNDEFDYL